jgi:hypothetical protein
MVPLRLAVKTRLHQTITMRGGALAAEKYLRCILADLPSWDSCNAAIPLLCALKQATACKKKLSANRRNDCLKRRAHHKVVDIKHEHICVAIGRYGGQPGSRQRRHNAQWGAAATDRKRLQDEERRQHSRRAGAKRAAIAQVNLQNAQRVQVDDVYSARQAHYAHLVLQLNLARRVSEVAAAARRGAPAARSRGR